MSRKISNKISKIKNWLVVMTTTKTTEGGFLYFQCAYFSQSITSLFSIISRPFANNLRTKMQKYFDKELIIKNRLGFFSVNAKNDSLTKSIESFEHKHRNWFTKADREKAIFIDIGANIGFYSLLAILHKNFKKAYAFEPNPETYPRLQRNVVLNNCQDKITICTDALSNENNLAILNAKSIHTGGSTLVDGKISEKSITKHQINTITFDEYSTINKIDPELISFIKIDVEGYEYKVIQGMKKTLENLKDGTRLFIEIHPHATHATETHEQIENSGFVLEKQSAQNNFLYILNRN